MCDVCNALRIHVFHYHLIRDSTARKKVLGAKLLGGVFCLRQLFYRESKKLLLTLVSSWLLCREVAAWLVLEGAQIFGPLVSVFVIS